jgi:hypothetical protein
MRHVNRRISVQAGPDIPKIINAMRGMTQMVACLPSKYRALSQSPVLLKKKKETRKRWSLISQTG